MYYTQIQSQPYPYLMYCIYECVWTYMYQCMNACQYYQNLCVYVYYMHKGMCALRYFMAQEDDIFLFNVSLEKVHLLPLEMGPESKDGRRNTKDLHADEEIWLWSCREIIRRLHSTSPGLCEGLALLTARVLCFTKPNDLQWEFTVHFYLGQQQHHQTRVVNIYGPPDSLFEIHYFFEFSFA